MLIDRRNFVLGSAAVAFGSALVPSRAFGRLFSPQILHWSMTSPHTNAVAKLELGGNSLAISSNGEVMVIDTKFPYLGAALREDAVALAGGGIESVAMLNTHHHGDHTGGNNAFVGHGECYAHAKAIERITGQFDRYQAGMKGAVAQANRNFPDSHVLAQLAAELAERADELEAEDWVPTHAIANGEALKVGELDLSISHFGPGHTDNDVVVRLEQDNLVHTGDLVFSGLHPFFDPDGGGSALGWIDSLKAVLELCDGDTVVVPGHGPVGGQEIVVAAKDYMEKLVAAVQYEIERGTPKDKVTEMSWPFMDGLGFEQIRSRAIDFVYDELSSQ